MRLRQWLKSFPSPMYSVLYIAALSNAKLVTEQNWKIASPVFDMMKRRAKILCFWLGNPLLGDDVIALKYITVNRYDINLDVTFPILP